MLDFCGLPVFISPENADIEIEARIFEIVRIAAVKGHLLFRRENNANIVVTLVAVKMINTALIKRDHIGAQAGFVFAFLFDLRDRVLARLARGVGRHSGFYRGVHLRGYIFDRHQHIELKIGAFDFFRVRLRIEAVLQVIVLLARSFLQRVRAHVMIGNAESVSGNERPAAAGIESDTRFLQMLEPLRRRLELILFLELLERRIVEEPHSFIGSGRNCGDKEHGRNKAERNHRRM